YDGKNVVGIAGFKSYVGLWFHQGALLKDEQKVLINAQEGTTKALRQWRMQSAKEIKPAVIKRYVKEAIQLVKDGKSIGPSKKKPLAVPPELKKAIGKTKVAQKKFAELTPGKQREYAQYIATAKREETKQNRLKKILPMIKSGIGLNDKYRR
ncbi:MAG: YdeI/OmpD-associated family protein, partial [Woeseiaceae bacterium]